MAIRKFNQCFELKFCFEVVSFCLILPFHRLLTYVETQLTECIREGTDVGFTGCKLCMEELIFNLQTITDSPKRVEPFIVYILLTLYDQPIQNGSTKLSEVLQHIIKLSVAHFSLKHLIFICFIFQE